MLFGHMLTAASHEKELRNTLIPNALREAGVEGDPNTLFDDMTINSRRTLLGLAFSGHGATRDTMTRIFKQQKRAGEAPDLNGLMGANPATFWFKSKLIRARATAMRALAMEIAE